MPVPERGTGLPGPAHHAARPVRRTPRAGRRLRAAGLLMAGAVALLTLPVAAGPGGPTAEAATPSEGLLVSSSRDGSSAVAVDGAKVSGRLYVRYQPSVPVQTVTFWLDDPDRSGSPAQTERLAPYDFAGGPTGEGAKAWDSSAAPGTRTITAEVVPASGSSFVVQATF